MAQNTLIPGLQPNQYTNIAAVSPGGSVPADNAQGLSTVSPQTQTANPGVAPPIQSTSQSLTTFTFLPTVTFKASAPGVPAGGVTQST